MKKEEIANLAKLARVSFTDAELDEYAKDLPKILEYVGEISEITAATDANEPQLSPRYNVFRQDEVTNQPNEFTDDILEQMPHTDGRFMKVKKIIDQGS